MQGPELSGAAQPVMQNRRGYCSCCHVHYNNLEQHVYSPQHRHFATYCRNRMGTSSLMDRFLQDVLQHHPYRYHDNRPTYDDMPFASSQLPRDEAHLSLDLAGKGKTANQGEEPSTDSGFTAESACLVSQRSHEELKNAFVSAAPLQRLESGRGHTIRASPPKLNTSWSAINLIPIENAVTETSNRNRPNTTVKLSPHPLPVSLLSSTPYVLGKTTTYAVTPESVPSNQHEQNKHDIRNRDRLLNPHLTSLLQPGHSRTIPFSLQSPACNQGCSVISGQLFCKEDGLQSQDKTLISDFCLRNTSNLVGTSSSLTFQASSQLSDTHKRKVRRGTETSVDEIIEEVILKYCHESAPRGFICGDGDSNSSVNVLSLIDKSSVHGSDLSFDCDATVQSRALPPKVSVKNLEPLKARQVTLQDDDTYGLQLRSILGNNSGQQKPETKKEKPVCDKEPVLPALPHVPPSFVGKTWSQIMHEDDMKIEALVRDFREGHFRCHFDTESLTRRTKRRLRKQKMKKEERLHLVASKETKATSAKGFPELADASDFSSSSAISETRHIPETQTVPEALKRPRKGTWGLASRCQVVKVSHGTQTSLVDYPVVKQKVIRKKSDSPVQKAGFLWPWIEQTPNMKTRLCALKLPKSYTKIMSPVQPQTVVYVLSCPERKQLKSRAEDFPQLRRNHHSTDSKESIRYKYKQSCIKYYDPLTNRILKTPPKSLVGEKPRKPHVRQLFRSLTLDANNKKQVGKQYDCVTPKSFSSTDLRSLSIKEKDMNSSHSTEASSVSLDRPECLVCNGSEKSYKHVEPSPLNAHQLTLEDEFSLIPLRKKQSSKVGCLGRDNPKTGWQREKGSSREPGFPKKALVPAFGRHNLIKRGNKVQLHRTTERQKEGRVSACSPKSRGLSTPSHQKTTATVGKHLKKDGKILKVARKSKRTFLSSAAIIGMSEKRQRATTKTSSRVRK